MHLNGESSFILSITNVIIISWKYMFAIVVAKKKFLIYSWYFLSFCSRLSEVGYSRFFLEQSHWITVRDYQNRHSLHGKNATEVNVLGHSHKMCYWFYFHRRLSEEKGGKTKIRNECTSQVLLKKAKQTTM